MIGSAAVRLRASWSSSTARRTKRLLGTAIHSSASATRNPASVARKGPLAYACRSETVTVTVAAVPASVPLGEDPAPTPVISMHHPAPSSTSSAGNTSCWMSAQRF